MSDWENTTERYLCFIDIMGFKDRLSRLGHEKVLSEIQELYRYVKEIIDEFQQDIKNDKELLRIFGPTEVRYITFSDSILLMTGGKNKKDLTLLILVSAFVLEKSLQMKLPLKGALAKGKFTADFTNNIFLGQALVDAFILQEELNYYGIIANREVERDIDQAFVSEEYKTLIFSLQTPMKGYKTLSKNITIISHALEKTTLQNLYYYVDGKARVYVDNTIEMFDKMIIERNKLK
jgi:hypothetical protein